MQAEILAEVRRGDVVESLHRGHIVILDGKGEVISFVGDPNLVTFMRSSAKPLQVLPFLLSGAAERFDFSDQEIALACASHSGEDRHVRIVEAMLSKIGLDDSFLQCGAHLPFDEKSAEDLIRNSKSPTQLHNNCSGKHTCMLGLTKHLGADLKSYLRLESPAQQAILQVIADFTETPKDCIRIAVDGCSAPNFAVRISSMAKAIAKLINPPEDFDMQLRAACNRVVSAMTRYPELVGGNLRLDTLLMRACPEALVSKIGAEGIWLCGILPSTSWPQGVAIAVKIEDGDDKRARAVVAIEILRQLRILDENTLHEYSPLPVKNRKDEIVGEVRPCFKLN